MKFCPYYPKPDPLVTNLSSRKFLVNMVKEKTSWINLMPAILYRTKISSISIPGLRIFVINDPELVKAILVDKGNHYPKHYFLHYLLKDLLGISIFTTNNDIWQKQREIVDQGFLVSKIDSVYPSMKCAADDMLERLGKMAGGFADIDAEMTFITADIMFRTILSSKIENVMANELFKNFLAFQKAAQRMLLLKICHLPAIISKYKSKKYAKLIRHFLINFIDRRYDLLEQGMVLPDDILNTLINAKDNSGKSFDRVELIDQICMLFLAGHETSAASLAWTLYLIANDNEVQNKIYNEIMRVCPEEIEVEDLRYLSYISNVFRESLRLFPPVSILLREATEDHYLKDCFIKKGSILIISPWIIHRHENQWQEPDVFDPDRFSSSECKHSISRSFLPFSKGQRVCPGAGFATQEAILIIAMIVKNFIIEADPEHIPIPIDKLTLRSKNGIKLKFIKR